MQHLIERFIKYATIDTTSAIGVEKIPSTDTQFELAHKLVEELKALGLEAVQVDANGYVMATLPANMEGDIPVVGFIAHMDTSPDFNGKNVNPQLITNYNGTDIVLNKEKKCILSPKDFPELKNYLGQTLITTDGTSLLGADDKAGITEIVSAMEYLIAHPELKHGKIRIAFTPDEEVGKGASLFDVEKFGADWAYTVDGSGIGALEYENFNAAEAMVTIKGKSVHPGYAKGKMINALHIANVFIDSFPKDEVPEKTDGYQGFYHLYEMQGSVSHATLKYLIRDHDKTHFEQRKDFFKKTATSLNKSYGEAVVTVNVNDQYYNMREKIEPVKHIVDTAREAIKKSGVLPVENPTRGGTDGSQLSYKGLPCPNIFAGGHNFHGPFEYLPVESMAKAVAVIVAITTLTADKYHG